MPSIHKDPASSNFRIRFRYNGRNIQRSLKTSNRRKAVAMCQQVEETLHLIERGRIEIPGGIDVIGFILAGGQVTPQTKPSKSIGLSTLFETYLERLPKGRKEESTLLSERIHVKHLKRHLGANRTVQTLTKANLQTYVEKRLKDAWRGKPLTPETVRNELVTLRILWNWGVKEGLLRGTSPVKDVEFPLADEKLPFMTRQEIKEVIERGGLTMDAEEGLWEALYLHVNEVQQALETIQEFARHTFIYPMMVFVAHTGCRRSEMVRSRIEDVDFKTKTIMLREKKRSRTKAITYRRVDMSPLLYEVMSNWIANHPGGQHTFAQLRLSGEATPITVNQAHYHLGKTLETTEWKIIRGFHVFRHSFASNLAAAAVDQRVIDEFMGHQTEEMRRRYRHLFPAIRQAAIASVFGEQRQQTVVTIAG